MIEEGYRVADTRIAEYAAGRLSLLPGCDEEQVGGLRGAGVALRWV